MFRWWQRKQKAVAVIPVVAPEEDQSKKRKEPSLISTAETKLMKLVAGLTLEQAVDRAIELNHQENITGLINIAGEHYQDELLAVEDAERYCKLLHLIHRKKAPCSISIKPTQIGQGLGKDLFLANLNKIATLAEKLGRIPVELDMEAPETMKETIDVFCETVTKHKKLLMRLAVQAEFRDSLETARRIVAAGGGVRLVRGKAYGDMDDSSLVYETPEQLNANFVEIARIVPPSKLAVATGNVELLRRVYAAVASTGQNKIQHQYLFGLPYHESVYRGQANQGKKVALYMPCGSWKKVRDYVRRRDYLTAEEYNALDSKFGLIRSVHFLAREEM